MFEPALNFIGRMMATEGVRLDAAASAFYTRQLEHIYSQTYDIRFPALKARMFVPVSNQANEGATSVTYRQNDRSGEAKFITSNAKDLPRVDVFGNEFNRPVRSIGAAYGWTLKELMSALMAGEPLNARKAAAARRAVEEILDFTACFGDASVGIVDGFLNEANIPVTNAPNGAGGDEEWNTKTAQEILDDVSAAVTRMAVATLNVEVPDTIVLPNEAYSHIATQPRSTTSDTTILNYILQNFPMIQAIEPWYRLNTAGAASEGRMVTYRRAPDVLTQEIPMEFRQLSPQEQGLELVVNTWAQTAGTAVYYPLAVDFTDRVS